MASRTCCNSRDRLAADGTVVFPLSQIELDELLAKIESLAPDAVAINLLFSFLDDSVERSIATWLNAALGPIIRRYLATGRAVEWRNYVCWHGSAIGGKSIAIRPHGRTYCNRLSGEASW